MEQVSAFLEAVLAVAHPSTFQTGMRCVKAIGENKTVKKTENLKELMAQGCLVIAADNGLCHIP